MSSYPLDIDISIKVFNTVQDMTRSHKMLLNALKEVELQNSEEFDQIENESSNFIALCEDLRNYLNKTQFPLFNDF